MSLSLLIKLTTFWEMHIIRIEHREQLFLKILLPMLLAFNPFRSGENVWINFLAGSQHSLLRPYLLSHSG